jgi:SNF2 family DNA or RNA helicase
LRIRIHIGKTIQTVAFLHQLRYMPTTQLNGPFLIIAPLSLVDQWQSEIALWSPNMNCVLLHGCAAARELIFKHEFYFTEPFCSKDEAAHLKKRNVCKFHILLTTFEVATKEIRMLSKINWQVQTQVLFFACILIVFLFRKTLRV